MFNTMNFVTLVFFLSFYIWQDSIIIICLSYAACIQHGFGGQLISLFVLLHEELKNHTII